MDNGRKAVEEARIFAQQNDKRIRDDGSTSYWGDSRADSLDVQTINGLEVSKYDPGRNLRDMRRNLKLIGAMANGKSSLSGKSTAPHTQSTRDFRRFMAPGTAGHAPLTREPSYSTCASATGSSSTGESSIGNKRPHMINLSDDEDEIRQQTRVVEDGPSTGKKAKVTVVIK